MSNAAALGIGAGIGVVWTIVVFFAVLRGWLKRAGRLRGVTIAVALFVPLGIGAISAPNFKTGMILWLGGPLGIGIAQPFTIALRAFRKSE